MFTRTSVGIALSCSALFLSGCGSGAEKETNKAQGKTALALGDQSTTLHVEGMTKRLNLF